MKYSLVVTLCILAIAGYSWYRYVNRDVVTIGSMKSEKELGIINDFRKCYQTSLQKERKEYSSVRTYKILNGGDFYKELMNFRKYLQVHDVDFDDTILEGEYNLSSDEFFILLKFQTDIQEYNFIGITFDSSNTLTEIMLNGFIGLAENQKKQVEQDLRGYEIAEDYDYEKQQDVEKLMFTLQTGEFFDYFSAHPNITPKEFVRLIMKDTSKIKNNI